MHSLSLVDSTGNFSVGVFAPYHPNPVTDNLRRFDGTQVTRCAWKIIRTVYIPICRLFVFKCLLSISYSLSLLQLQYSMLHTETPLACFNYFYSNNCLCCCVNINIQPQPCDPYLYSTKPPTTRPALTLSMHGTADHPLSHTPTHPPLFPYLVPQRHFEFFNH